MINYCVWIHSLPRDLEKPLPPERVHLTRTSDLYQWLIDIRLIWRVWQIDEYGHHWIEVGRVEADGSPSYDLLVVDEGTFDRIECEPYEIEYLMGADGV